MTICWAARSPPSGRADDERRLYVGAVGLQSQQRALDIIASNMANINTPAFKRSEIRFSEVLARRTDSETPNVDIASAAFDGGGVMVDATAMVNETGPIQTTGHAMDLAIDGQGFIELDGAFGSDIAGAAAR